MSELSIQEIMEHVFTTPNPETGGMPAEHLAWVIFENGTVLLTAPTETLPVDATPEEIVAPAVEALEAFGPACGGTPSGDFSVHKLSWYPEDFIYMITYNHPAILNIVQFQEEPSDISAGFQGRSIRGEDAREAIPKLIRDFNGKLHQC